MNIVVLDGFTLNPGDLSWHALEALGVFKVYEHTLPQDVLERCHNAQLILTNKTVLDAKLLTQLPNVKYIGVLATGTNVVDVAEAKRLGITVTNVPAYGPDAVAQMVFAHILHFTQQVALHSRAVKKGEWTLQRDFCFTLSPLISLKGKTLGLIGYGDIAKKVCQIGLAFGMNVLINTPSQKTDLPSGVTWLPLNELLTLADIVSLHCPLTPATLKLINTENLSLLKQDVILINTARGDLVDEAELATWLIANKGFAGLDVLSTEPPAADNPLLHSELANSERLVITPHIAWATKEARQNLLNIAVTNCQQFLKGTPVNCV